MLMKSLQAVTMRVLVKEGRRSLAVMRVVSYVVFAGCLAAVVSTRVARGAMSEATLSLGRQLEGIRDLLGSTKVATVNGQRVYVSTAVVPLDVKTVLDRFERECASNPNALLQAIHHERTAERLSHAAPASAAPPGLELRAKLGIMREDDEHDGVVACLAQRRDTRRSLPELAYELGRTLDVGLLGDFFYTYAVKTKEGESHVITTWTLGSFKPLEMFPSSGDAPGADSPMTPRPRDTRRVFSGIASDAPYAIRVYESKRDLATVLASFDQDMKARHWTRVEEVASETKTRAYIHASGIQVIATANSSNERTLVSLVEMGAGNSRPHAEPKQ
ncbi:MAG TPA: hypothetical protein VKP30_12090 [Polyangiaceae bacterium]|nr:hypothetical protein [Polyangiaceae bacterium]